MSHQLTNVAGQGAFGYYIHVPFCARRCDYCAFATWTDRHHLMAAYSAACRAEIQAARLPAASTVFFSALGSHPLFGNYVSALRWVDAVDVVAILAILAMAFLLPKRAPGMAANR